MFLIETVKKHIEQPQIVAPVTMFSLKDMCDQTLELYLKAFSFSASTRPFGYTFDKISATPPRFQPITGVPNNLKSLLLSLCLA
jgi:hypothetical protein